MFVLSGCSLKEIREQTNAIENAGVIKGNVKVKSPQKGPIVILRYKENNGVLSLVSSYIASSDGDYHFVVLPGVYLVAAFIDVNNDGKYQSGEHGNFHIDPLMLKVEADQICEVKTLYIKGTPPEIETNLKINTDIIQIFKNIGTVTSMNDPIFANDNYSMGMWRPLDFLDQVGGGLFFLQEYDKDKIPIVFVHGVNGGPENWKDVIESLDREYFQPWVLYYPSGMRLDMISDYFLQSIIQIQNQYHFKKINIIAHSMGGLVTRSFVKKYTEDFPDHSKHINLVMTINSPMAGMSSAASGVKHSPIVVPAWRDVAPDSPFLKNIYAWAWPEYIPYHLVFSYKTGESGDGTVALESQIPLNLQSESIRMYGFNNNHVSILSDEKFISLFNKILEDSYNSF